MKIMLESASGAKLGEATDIGNEAYLCQEDVSLPLLSLLSNCSCDVFASADMPQLIEDLSQLKKRITDQQACRHLDDIISLAAQCILRSDTTLTFTPFA